METLRAPGVVAFTDGLSASELERFAGRLETLGYTTMWLPELTGREPFAHVFESQIAHHQKELEQEHIGICYRGIV